MAQAADTLVIRRDRLGLFCDALATLVHAERRGVNGWEGDDYLPPAITPRNFSLAAVEARFRAFGCIDTHFQMIAAARHQSRGAIVLLRHVASENPALQQTTVRVRNLSRWLGALGCPDALDACGRMARAIASGELTENDFREAVER